MTTLVQVYVDGQLVESEVANETELRPRPIFRRLPAWLQRLMAWFGVRVYDEITHQVVRLEKPVAFGAFGVIKYETTFEED